MPIEGFHPAVAAWFEDRFGEPSEPQAQGWPAIRRGAHVLISAPTGSGKTLAAFLCAIDSLVRQSLEGELAEGVQVLYVSPLKALANDVRENLLEPLREIRQTARRLHLDLPELRTLVRTGDTPPAERRDMGRRPPHILVTTPESLYILLTTGIGRRLLQPVRSAIIDEIHALARDKRGAHLTLSLERLEALTGRALQRVGLSATQQPVELIAQFLTGPARRAQVLDLGHRRTMDLAVEAPRHELGAVAGGEMWEEVYDRLADLIRQHRTTLVFVNTRRLAERMTHHLTARLGPGIVAAHHGSLSRQLRLDTETRLKQGEMRAVVATASLELGLDIGSVDLVCQIGSPRSIALALQRIGRSGHWKGAVPKGRIFATTRDELIECAALVRAIRRGELDEVRVPLAPLDILAQQIVAAASVEEWREDALFDLVRRSHSYAQLQRADFDAVIAMLAEGVRTRRGRAGARLHRDRVNGLVRGRRGARLAAVTSGGAIPDSAAYLVKLEPDGTTVGTVDEDFAAESIRGDVFLLGNASWRIRRIESGCIRVEDAHGAAPDIPFWRGEAPARTDELSLAFAELREELTLPEDQEHTAGLWRRESELASDYRNGCDVDAPAVKRGRADWSPPAAAAASSDAAWPPRLTAERRLLRLAQECGLDRWGGEQLRRYVQHGRTGLGLVPGPSCIAAERFLDESGGMQVVIHAPFGSRVNRAWGMILRARLGDRLAAELQAAATENGILLSLGAPHGFPLDSLFSLVPSGEARELLTRVVLASALFATRWRWNASRALTVLRFSDGRKIPPPLLRMQTDDLLAAVFPERASASAAGLPCPSLPDHLLVQETLKECLTDALDVDGLQAALERIETGRIRCVTAETREPSCFSHEIVHSNPYAFLDSAPLAERRARAIQTRRTLPADAAELCALDEDAIRQVVEEARPVIRDADELHDALLTLGLMPDRDLAGQEEALEALRRQRRVHRVQYEGQCVFWVATERARLAARLYPSARLDPELDLEQAAATARQRDLQMDVLQAACDLVGSRLEHAGPTTAQELAGVLKLPNPLLEQTLQQLEAEGQVLRGRFRPGAGELEWCSRRLLARIHRLTLTRLRREIEPVSAPDFMRFLFHWQHVAEGARLYGEAGLTLVLDQLQGFEAASVAWERHVLPRRVAGYTPALLDQLCLSGRFVWGRLTTPAAGDDQSGKLATPLASDEALDYPLRVTPRGLQDQVHRTSRRSRVRPTRIAPVAFFRREKLPHYLTLWGKPRETALVTPGDPAVPRPAREALRQPGHEWERPEHGPSLSHPAQEALQVLSTWGACFADDLVRATGRLPIEIEEGLWELAVAGLATADCFDNLRALIDPRRRTGPLRPSAAKRRKHAQTATQGRWTLLRLPGSSVDTFEHRRQQAFEEVARQLLNRWGVVFRDLLLHESLAPRWRNLLPLYRRWEDRGEVQGGRFVAGCAGEQFALPEAVDALRSVRRSRDKVEVVRFSAADPLNLLGIVLPGARTRPHPDTLLTFRDGTPV